MYVSVCSIRIRIRKTKLSIFHKIVLKTKNILSCLLQNAMVKKLLLLCRNDNQLKLTDGNDNYIIIMEEMKRFNMHQRVIIYEQ